MLLFLYTIVFFYIYVIKFVYVELKLKRYSQEVVQLRSSDIVDRNI